jgi:hypothetical protein
LAVAVKEYQDSKKAERLSLQVVDGAVWTSWVCMW